MTSIALVMLCRDTGSPHPEKPQRLGDRQPSNMVVPLRPAP